MRPHILMTDPAHFDVRYAINPWMRPGDWAVGDKMAAARGWGELKRGLEMAGARVTVIDGDPAWPDMVFAANAAVVFDGACVVARFKHAERQGEESRFHRAFDALAGRGEIDTVLTLPPGLIQEGAGDFIWDAHRQLFWAGFGPRSDKAAASWVGEALGSPPILLELATDNFYHLDTCFCPLAGGEVLYYPPAFTVAALARIREHVAADALIEADPVAAGAFCVNAVNLGRVIVMAKSPPRLRAQLADRGYQVVEVDLAPFILSGGAAFCLTLRLDNAPDPDVAATAIRAAQQKVLT